LRALSRSSKRCTTTNIEGANRTARQVEAIIPLKTAIPIDARAYATLAREKVTHPQKSRSLAVKFTQIGRGHVGVTEVDLGLLRIGLRRLQVGLRGVALVRLRLDGEQRRAFFT
jgi:hypothetical protein